MTISRQFFLRMRNVFNKSCRENQNTNFMSHTFFSKIAPFLRKCRKMQRSQRGRNDVTIRRICVAYWISKATGAWPPTHTPARARTRTHRDKYVLFIALPRQEYSAKAPQRYTCIACLVKYTKDYFVFLIWDNCVFLYNKRHRIIAGVLYCNDKFPFSVIIIEQGGKYKTINMKQATNC